jgi:hypothetical protein
MTAIATATAMPALAAVLREPVAADDGCGVAELVLAAADPVG